jgi:hypothetical protein
MGTMFYGSPSLELQIDDWPLSHLQVVIGSKLRRRESFFFSWAQGDDVHGEEGQSTVWLSPAIPLMFTYSHSPAPELNIAWLHLLAELANSGRGLVLLPEPAAAGERSVAPSA